MGIERITPMSNIMAHFRAGQERLFAVVVRRLTYIGEQVVTTARRRGSYTDRTGNLRSSTGYVVVCDGQIVQMSGFPSVQGQGENMQRVTFTTKTGKAVDYWAKGPSGDGTEGSSEGRKLAEELASQVGNGRIALIVVAGMNYAQYVADKGFDVLDSSYIEARRLADQMIRQLGLQ